jgi:biotin synthase
MLCCVQVISTRTYDDRLDTISHVRDAGISVCSGGILGLGESDADRVGLIWEASRCAPCFREGYALLPDVHSMPEHPESFPVNALVPIEGTPLENNEVGFLLCFFPLGPNAP